jgi:hypothetical protein
LPGFFGIEGTPQDWASREVALAFRMHRHWVNGHRLTGDCIADEPATLIDGIEHVAAMLAWCEREAAERAKQEAQQLQAQSNARRK